MTDRVLPRLIIFPFIYRLANLIHKLSDLGAVSPARIGPEGTPVPLDHVLQLVEDQNNIGELRESEEDSD